MERIASFLIQIINNYNDEQNEINKITLNLAVMLVENIGYSVALKYNGEKVSKLMLKATQPEYYNINFQM